MKIVLAFCLLARPCCAASISVQPGEPGTLVHPIVGLQINITEILMTCSQDFYRPIAALKDFETLDKEIKNRIKKHKKDCSRVSPLSRPVIEIRNKLLCTINEWPNAKGFRTVKNAFNHSLVSYYSLEECQDSVSKLPEATTEMSEVNDNESTTKSEIDVVTDLNPSEKPVTIVSNPNDEVVSSLNPTKAAVTRNNSTHHKEELNGGTDNEKNGKDATTPKLQDITEAEATGNSTGDSGSNQPLKINAIGIALVIVALASLAFILIHRFKDRFQSIYSLCRTNSNTNLI